MDESLGGASRTGVGFAFGVVIVSATLLFVAVVVVATADASSPPVAWLGILPIAASLLMTWRQTVLVAGGSMAVAVGLAAVYVGTLTSRTALGVLTVSVLGLIAVVNSAFRARTSGRLARATTVARTLEDVVRTELPGSATGVTLATWRSPSDEDIDLGGDVVDLVESRSGSRLILGDVIGHGLSAVKVAAGVATAFRAAAGNGGHTLVDVAAAVDRYVVQNVGEEDFVTAVFLEFDRNGWLQIVNCGHPAPIQLRRSAGSPARQLTPRRPSTPLGLAPHLSADHFPVADGDRILVCTDGVLEARSPDGSEFALEAQLEQNHEQLLRVEPTSAVHTLVEALLDHTGRRLQDDATILLIEVVENKQPPKDRRGWAAKPVTVA